MEARTTIGYLVDFDGTITTVDTLEYILDRYGDRNWRDFDEQVESGECSEMEALTKQLASITIPLSEAIAELKTTIEFREGFLEFIEWTKGNRFPVRIISAGLEEIIRSLLEQNRIECEVYANHFVSESISGGWVFANRFDRLPECRQSICKCIALFEPSSVREIVYIGDQTPDLCPSRRSDIRYAVSGRALERHFLREQLQHCSFHDFTELVQLERNRLEQVDHGIAIQLR